LQYSALNNKSFAMTHRNHPLRRWWLAALVFVIVIVCVGARKQFASIDPAYDANRHAYNSEIEYVDREWEQEEEEEDQQPFHDDENDIAEFSLMENRARAWATSDMETSGGAGMGSDTVAAMRGGDDDGVYYDAANMPTWLVPPWVAQNSPVGPLIPTYGSGYLSKTFNIDKWKGAIPPQPVFPLDTGYAGAAVDSDHFPYSGVFPNDARYHSPALSVTAPIFVEAQSHTHAHAQRDHAYAFAAAAKQQHPPPLRGRHGHHSYWHQHGHHHHRRSPPSPKDSVHVWDILRGNVPKEAEDRWEKLHHRK
jgi:hypothetical protein